MASKKINDQPLVSVVSGNEKIPTGVVGDLTISVNQIREYANTYTQTVIEQYSTAGTYTVTAPTFAKFAHVFLLGAGGGGAAGGVASGTPLGGAGGGGASCSEAVFDVSAFSGGIVLTIGAGGTGGIGTASSAAVSTQNGAGGGNTSLGTLLAAFGGGGASRASGLTSFSGGGAGALGAGGNASTTVYGTAGLFGGNDGGSVTDLLNTWGGTAGTEANAASLNSKRTYRGGCGGAAGGNVDATSAKVGGKGVTPASIPQNDTPQTPINTDAPHGVNPDALFCAGQSGAGGGGSFGGVPAGDGGNGGRGSGGGGGGAVRQSSPIYLAGNGGNGGDGYAVIIWCA